MALQRPIVVLAGWLGCQPRHLGQYERMYKTLGLDVVTCIATPRMVVSASRSSPPFLSEEASPPNSIQAISWKLFRDVEGRDIWFFHAFSNGGCFVWEQLRRILSEQQQHDNNKGDAKNKRAISEPAGLIFDSSPASYQGTDNLNQALAYCTWKDQAVVRIESIWGGASMKRTSQERARTYWDGLVHDEFDTRQLYLCSHDDELTSFEDVKKLVLYRQGIFGQDRVLLKEWQSSPHCGHILKHPDEYREAVASFVASCSRDYKVPSRL